MKNPPTIQFLKVESEVSRYKAGRLDKEAQRRSPTSSIELDGRHYTGAASILDIKEADIWAPVNILYRYLLLLLLLRTSPGDIFERAKFTTARTQISHPLHAMLSRPPSREECSEKSRRRWSCPSRRRHPPRPMGCTWSRGGWTWRTSTGRYCGPTSSDTTTPTKRSGSDSMLALQPHA